MRQQSYFLYDDSTKLWSKLKSDMLNPTVSSFIDMEKTTVPSGAITLSDVESMLQFQTSSEGPSFSSLFDYNFSYSNDMDNDANNSSFIMRIENSRDISNLMTDNTFDMAKDSIHPDQPFDSLIKQQHIFDHIYMSDMGRMEDYDMFDYGFDIQQQQEVSAVLNAPLARQNQAQSNAFDFPLDTADMHLDHQKQQSDARARYISPLNQASPRLGAPDLITTADYYSLGPIHNRSGPPSLIQEEDEEQDNMSISSISTGNLSTIFPIRVVNDSVTPRTDVNTTRRVRRMVASTTMLSYAEDYSTDRLLRGLTPSIQKSQRQQKLTEKQRMAIIRKCLRYPSTVLDTFSYNTNLLTEQGAGGQQHQVLAFFNRNRLADDQVSWRIKLPLVLFKLH
ncbi:hypothetical protein BD408DRAFT_143368 [Parasitella parasitica]|nr:hypothetical protein BD408DRAFT_143368 [Parasitella parasitica]